MKTALFTSEKEADLQLLLELANRLGIKIRLLDEEEMEELGLIHAIETGKTVEFVNTEDYLQKLRSGTFGLTRALPRIRTKQKT